MVPARIACIALLFNLLGLSSAFGDARLCNTAAIGAADNASIPREVMLSLTLTETGRSRNGSFDPWPWTVNMEGKGYWFDTRAEALTFVTEAYEAGARSFDIGCFQINHRWHGEAFASFDQMFEPSVNAAYAAKFLTSLLVEGGTWSEAVGSYHSKTAALAEKYRERFERILANLNGGENVELPPVMATAETGGVTTWGPFLQTDEEAPEVVNGSLAGALLLNGANSLLTSASGALF